MSVNDSQLTNNIYNLGIVFATAAGAVGGAVLMATLSGGALTPTGYLFGAALGAQAGNYLTKLVTGGAKTEDHIAVAFTAGTLGTAIAINSSSLTLLATATATGASIMSVGNRLIATGVNLFRLKP